MIIGEFELFEVAVFMRKRLRRAESVAPTDFRYSFSLETIFRKVINYQLYYDY